MSERDDAERLIAAARTAALTAHAPYSRFAVGAALLMTDGSIVTGANVENASYGLSLCAETVAVAIVGAQGLIGEVVAVGVIGGAMDVDGRPTGTAPVSPCGRCRQILNEAAQMGGRDLAVHCGAAEGDAIASYRLSALLPAAFGPADLGIGTARSPHSARPHPSAPSAPLPSPAGRGKGPARAASGKGEGDRDEPAR